MPTPTPKKSSRTPTHCPPIRPPLPMLQADQSHLASFHPSQLTCPLMLRTCSSFLEHFPARREPSFDCVCPPTVPLSGPHFSSHQHCRPRTPRLPEVLESCWSFWLHHILLRAIDVLMYASHVSVMGSRTTNACKQGAWPGRNAGGVLRREQWVCSKQGQRSRGQTQARVV